MGGCEYVWYRQTYICICGAGDRSLHLFACDVVNKKPADSPGTRLSEVAKVILGPASGS